MKVPSERAILQYIVRKYQAGAAVVVNPGPDTILRPKVCPEKKMSASPGKGTSIEKIMCTGRG